MIIICRADGTPIVVTDDIDNVNADQLTLGWFTYEIDDMPSSLQLRNDIALTLNHVDVGGLSKYYISSGQLYERENWVEPND